MNGEQFLNVISGVIDKSKDAPQLIMAIVGALDNSTTPSGSKAFLKFDGATSNNPYSYPMLDSAYPLSTNQRVLVARIGGNYLIVGKVKTYT